MASTSSFIPSKRPHEEIADSDVPMPSKGPTLPPATSQRFKNAVVLAPMVRSGTMPTRLLALKYGASLVWGPEIVDKAMLHAKRVVDSKTGVVSFEGITSSIWSCHPSERPYLIYQIGSSNPSLAVAAALRVSRDISGVDLNCGCPKPFSTSGGMGAALLDTPDLLCNILTSLRKALPSHLSVSCKIRLLPDREKTLELVRKFVRTGINCLTVHCRTRNMRMSEKAMTARLKEIVECVKEMRDENGEPLDVAILANGDVEGLRDMERVRNISGADGVMIATKAEENPSCFMDPMAGFEELVVRYLRIANYLTHGFANTKHCVGSFKSAPGSTNQKAALKALRNTIASAKDYPALESLVRENSNRYPPLPSLLPSSLISVSSSTIQNSENVESMRFDEETWGGEREVEAIVASIKERGEPYWWDANLIAEWEAANPPPTAEQDERAAQELLEKDKEERPKKKNKVDKADTRLATDISRNHSNGQALETPVGTLNPEPSAIQTPGSLFTSHIPPFVAGRNERSPSPERPERASLIHG